MKYRSKPRGGEDNRPVMVYANDKIKAFTIRIIDEEGNKLGEFSRQDALKMAQDMGKDLVQLSYDRDTKISTAKIADMGKFSYDKKKKEKEKKKQQKQQSKGIKEVKISYSIGEHDMELKAKKAEELLQEGYSMKIVIQLKGRERSFPEKAIEKLKKMKERLAQVGRAQAEPKDERGGYYILLAPGRARSVVQERSQKID